MAPEIAPEMAPEMAPEKTGPLCGRGPALVLLIGSRRGDLFP